MNAADAAAVKSVHDRDDSGLNISGEFPASVSPSAGASGQPAVETATTPATKLAPEPAALVPPAAVATINSVDTIVDDMKLMNDAALAGVPASYGWARGPGHVLMCNEPRGTNTPSWWHVNNSYSYCVNNISLLYAHLQVQGAKRWTILLNSSGTWRI